MIADEVGYQFVFISMHVDQSRNGDPKFCTKNIK